MAVRSVKLKLLVPRDGSAESVRKRKALWATHQFVNDAAAAYAELLLEMRQEDVCRGTDDHGKDVIEPAAHWQAKLRARLAAKQLPPVAVAEALPLLKAFYGSRLIKSFVANDKGVAGTGNATDLNTWLSGLVDPASVAGEKTELRKQLLAELPLCEAADADFEGAARKMLAKSDAREALLEGPGTGVGWPAAYNANPTDSVWLDMLHKAAAKARLELADTTVSELKKLGVFPLLQAASSNRVFGSGVLNPFERMAAAQAAAALLPWETKRHEMRKRRDKFADQLNQWDTEFGASHATALAAIRAFEAEESERARRESLGNEGTGYRIGGRELRDAWTLLRDWLKGHSTATAAAREDKVRELQAKQGRSFGSHRLLSWLAKPAQQWLADHSAGDVVTRIAVRNARQRKLDTARTLPIWTGADAVKHPRFANFDPPNNTNQPGFDLRAGTQKGRLTLRLSLLTERADGLLLAQDHDFQLVPSRQMAEIVLHKDGKERALSWQSQDGIGRQVGDVGGSALLFSRDHAECLLERKQITRLERGAWPAALPVWFKLSLDIGAEHKALLKQRFKWGVWLNSALVTRNAKDAKGVPPPVGTRVLAVDLGLRSAATVSVWQVVDAATPVVAGKWRVPLSDTLSAVHERSAMLALPGEHVDAGVLAARRAANEKLAGLLAATSHLSTVFKLGRAEQGDRRRELLERLGEGDDRRARAAVATTAAERDGLRAVLGATQDAWAGAVAAVWRRLETDLAGAIAAYRKQQREDVQLRREARHGPGASQLPKQAAAERLLGGKSAWQIEYKERVRKLLTRWIMRQRPGDTAVRRLARKDLGKYCGGLLDHLTALKEDRAKTTADLIVQAARGRVRAHKDAHGRQQDRELWLAKYAPCDLIVMEDLGRYRFATDRPPSENRQLMQWTHREVFRLVQMQAEVEGIQVLETGAEFSSKFDARTWAPGVRCEPITKLWVERYRNGEMPWLADKADEWRREGIELAQLVPGQLLPTGSGEQFVAVSATGGLRVRHADLNAAQCIALRALTGHGTAFRLTARRLGDVFVSAKGLGKRPQGALWREFGSALPPAVVVLRPAGEVRYALRPFASARDAAAALGLQLGALRNVDATDAESDAEDGDLAELLAGADPDRATFFRDPSGDVHGGAWVQAKVFWAEVRRHVRLGLQAQGLLPAAARSSEPRQMQLPLAGALPGDDIPL